MKYLVSSLLVILLSSCSNTTTESYSTNEKSGNFTFTVVDSINYDVGNNFPSGTILLDSLNSGFWSFSSMNNKLISNNLDGSFKSDINIPTIDQPYGINQIANFYFHNKDSIFVYDARFLRLLLMNQDGDVKNYWKLNNIWENGSQSGLGNLLSVHKNDRNDLIIEITGFEANLQYSSKAFFELTNFLHRINLTTKTIELQGLKFPEDSPFRKQLYWTGAFPNVIKSKGKYIVVYPLDPNIYLYDSNMRIIKEFEFASKNFPKTSGGGNFPSPQERNAALITRKLNGFSLGLKPTFTVNNDEFLIRVYREPLGDNDNIPDDMSSFMRGGYPVNFYLQLFRLDLENSEILKVGSDLLISDQNVGNFLGKGKDGFLYFLGYNPKIESPKILKVELKIID